MKINFKKDEGRCIADGIIEFYKKGDEWYADVNEHTESENIMVAGADKVLQRIYDSFGYDAFHRKRVGMTLLMGERSLLNPEDILLKFTMLTHDKFGATYRISGSKAKELGIKGRIIWLCNVTHTALGAHPDVINVIKWW